MKADVKLYASLAKYLPKQPAGEPASLDLAEGTTVKGLLNQLGIPEKAVKLIFINSLHATEETVIQDGDRLGIFPPVAGGRSETCEWAAQFKEVHSLLEF